MEKIPTAKEMLETWGLKAIDHLRKLADDLEYRALNKERDILAEEVISWCKLHVEAALKAASEKVETTSRWCNNDWEAENPVGFYHTEVNKDSILNAYPLDKIV